MWRHLRLIGDDDVSASIILISEDGSESRWCHLRWRIHGHMSKSEWLRSEKRDVPNSACTRENDMTICSLFIDFRIKESENRSMCWTRCSRPNLSNHGSSGETQLIYELILVLTDFFERNFLKIFDLRRAFRGSNMGVRRRYLYHVIYTSGYQSTMIIYISGHKSLMTIFGFLK